MKIEHGEPKREVQTDLKHSWVDGLLRFAMILKSLSMFSGERLFESQS